MAINTELKELFQLLYAPCSCILFKYPATGEKIGFCVPAPLHSVISTVRWHSNGICKALCLAEEGGSKEANF